MQCQNVPLAPASRDPSGDKNDGLGLRYKGREFVWSRDTLTCGIVLFGLLVECIPIFVLLHVSFVTFLEVLWDDDIPVLTHSLQHSMRERHTHTHTEQQTQIHLPCRLGKSTASAAGQAAGTRSSCRPTGTHNGDKRHTYIYMDTRHATRLSNSERPVDSTLGSAPHSCDNLGNATWRCGPDASQSPKDAPVQPARS